MIGFEGVKTFVVPREIVQQTHVFLRRVGTAGCEGLVLWLGRVNGSTAHVTETYVPRQRAIRSHLGLGIHVDGDALYELSVYLYKNELQLLIQVHSHGEKAYHSDTDDHGSVATTIGSLSIVVPHFGRGDFGLSQIAVFKLTEVGWVPLVKEEISQALEFNEAEKE